MEPLTILEPACYGPKIVNIKNVTNFVKKFSFRGKKNGSSLWCAFNF